MAHLPRISGREVVKVFESFGWSQARQSGSHIILVLEGHPASLSVPNHFVCSQSQGGRERNIAKFDSLGWHYSR